MSISLSYSYLFVVDCSVSMARDDSTALKQTFRAIADSVRRLAIEELDHKIVFNIGIIFYNLHRGTQTFLKLKPPTASDVKRLIRLHSNNQFYEENIAPGEANPEYLISALGMAKAEITNLKSSTSVSRTTLILISDSDDPASQNPRILNVAKTVMSDLGDLRVFTTPLLLRRKDIDFSVDKFWNKLNYAPVDTPEGSGIAVQTIYEHDFSSNIDKALKNVSTPVSSRKGMLKFGAMELGIRFYPLCASRAGRIYGTPVASVNEQNNGINALSTEPQRSEYEFLGDTTGKIYDENCVKHGIYVGPKNKLKSEDTVSPLYIESNSKSDESSNNSWKLIIEVQKFIHYTTVIEKDLLFTITTNHSSLIRPTDEIIENSKSAFNILRKSLLKSRLVALVSLHQTNGSSVSGLTYAFDPTNPEGVAPLLEKLNDFGKSGSSLFHHGMVFVPLPFADDIRPIDTLVDDLDIDSKIDANLLSTDERNIDEDFQSIIRKLNMRRYNPNKFPSFRREKFKYILEHIALGLEIETSETADRKQSVCTIPDATLPRYSSIIKHTGAAFNRVARYYNVASIDTVESPKRARKSEPVDRPKRSFNNSSGL